MNFVHLNRFSWVEISHSHRIELLIPLSVSIVSNIFHKSLIIDCISVDALDLGPFWSRVEIWIEWTFTWNIDRFRLFISLLLRWLLCSIDCGFVVGDTKNCIHLSCHLLLIFKSKIKASPSLVFPFPNGSYCWIYISPPPSSPSSPSPSPHLLLE